MIYIIIDINPHFTDAVFANTKNCHTFALSFFHIGIQDTAIQADIPKYLYPEMHSNKQAVNGASNTLGYEDFI